MDKHKGIEKLNKLISDSNEGEQKLIGKVIECILELDGAELNSSFLENLISDYLFVSKKLEIATNEVDYLKEFDALTMVYDHKKFKDRLQYEMARKNRYGYHLSVIYIDVEGINEINNIFGYKAGDKVVHDIGHIIKGLLREVDLVAKWLGDDYIVLLPETDLGGCLLIAERLKDLIHKYRYKDTGMVSASFGVTEYEKDDDEKKLIQKAKEYQYESSTFGVESLSHH